MATAVAACTAVRTVAPAIIVHFRVATPMAAPPAWAAAAAKRTSAQAGPGHDRGARPAAAPSGTPLAAYIQP